MSIVKGCLASLIISQTIPLWISFLSPPQPLSSAELSLCLSNVAQLESLCCNMTLGMKCCKICHLVTVLL